jgi:hypothetical protein
VQNFIRDKYKQKCEAIIDDDSRGLLDSNIDTPDFVKFVQAIIRLQLHMVLSDPPIELSMVGCRERSEKQEITEKFEFWMFNKNDYYCIDGFPKEGYPCVVVLPPPYR